jgi:hypothetical protein
LPVDKYKAFYEIVKMLMRMDLTKLRSIQKELSVLSKVRSSGKKKSRSRLNAMNKNSKKIAKNQKKKKRATSAQLRARKQFAMRVRRGDFR